MHLRTFITGFLMGLADLVPGISGGTVALLGGIYARLMQAISGFDLACIGLLSQGKFKQCWQKIDGWFLCILALGVISALFSMAKLMQFLLANHTIIVKAVFLGLIASATLTLLAELTRLKSLRLVVLMLSIALGILLSTTPTLQSLDAVQGWQYAWVLVMAIIAISAMLLPGISGSFILLLLGGYSLLINSIAQFNWPVLLTFLSGWIIGIGLISRGITWLLNHYAAFTLNFLTGLMLGTIFKLWPWKYTTIYTLPEPILDPQTIVPIKEILLLPWRYAAITGEPSHWLYSLIGFIIGFILVQRLGRIKFDDWLSPQTKQT